MDEFSLKEEGTEYILIYSNCTPNFDSSDLFQFARIRSCALKLKKTIIWKTENQLRMRIIRYHQQIVHNVQIHSAQSHRIHPIIWNCGRFQRLASGQTRASSRRFIHSEYRLSPSIECLPISTYRITLKERRGKRQSENSLFSHVTYKSYGPCNL